MVYQICISFHMLLNFVPCFIQIYFYLTYAFYKNIKLSINNFWIFGLPFYQYELTTTIHHAFSISPMTFHYFLSLPFFLQSCRKHCFKHSLLLRFWHATHLLVFRPFWPLRNLLTCVRVVYSWHWESQIFSSLSSSL